MRRARIGLVGCGIIARQSHLPVIQALSMDALELVAACDVFEERAREVGQEYKVPHYSDAEKMLKEHREIEIVDICTAHWNHHIVGKLAAENGSHVIVEKPMALTLPCADLMIKACEKAGVHWEVAENYYRMPEERLKVKAVENGLIGVPTRAYVFDPAKPPSTEGAIDFRGILELGGGGVCIDNGPHCASLLRKYLGCEARSVAGLTKQFTPREGLTVEDWGLAIIEFEKGRVGMLEGAWQGKVTHKRVVGTEGEIETQVMEPPRIPEHGDETYRAVVGGKMTEVERIREAVEVGGRETVKRLVVKSKPEVVWENPFKEYGLSDWHIGIADEILSIVNAALYDREPEYGVQGRKDLEIIEALYESSLRGMAPVDIPITSTTGYERKVHEAFERRFGYYPLAV